MSATGKAIYEALLRIDATLAASGIPPISDRWRAELRAYYLSGATVHAGRMGRGAAKSTNAAKCLVAEVLAGDWRVPNGERHWAIAISENISEASARLGQIEAYLRALGVAHERSGDQIVLTGIPLGFWVRAARIGALSGPRVVAWSVDEAAKLNVEGHNPAAELIASLKAASITHPGARGRVYSSPFGSVGYHYELIERGPDASTYVSVGATWEYNPSISEARTRELEPDERIWAREYLAVPGSADEALLDSGALERARRPTAANVPPPPSGVPTFASADLATRGNASTLAIVWLEKLGDGGVPRLVVGVTHQWIGSRAAPLALSSVFADMATICRRYRARHVLCDQWSFDASRELARQRGLTLKEMTTEDRHDMYQRLAKYTREERLSLPGDPVVHRDLVSLRLRATSTGYRVELPSTSDGRHCDYAPAIALGALQADRRGPVSQLDDYERGIAERLAGRGIGAFGGSCNLGPRPFDGNDHSQYDAFNAGLFGSK